MSSLDASTQRNEREVIRFIASLEKQVAEVNLRIESEVKKRELIVTELQGGQEFEASMRVRMHSRLAEFEAQQKDTVEALLKQKFTVLEQMIQQVEKTIRKIEQSEQQTMGHLQTVMGTVATVQRDAADWGAKVSKMQVSISELEVQTSTLRGATNGSLDSTNLPDALDAGAAARRHSRSSLMSHDTDSLERISGLVAAIDMPRRVHSKCSSATASGHSTPTRQTSCLLPRGDQAKEPPQEIMDVPVQVSAALANKSQPSTTLATAADSKDICVVSHRGCGYPIPPSGIVRTSSAPVLSRRSTPQQMGTSDVAFVAHAMSPTRQVPVPHRQSLSSSYDISPSRFLRSIASEGQSPSDASPVAWSKFRQQCLPSLPTGNEVLPNGLALPPAPLFFKDPQPMMPMGPCIMPNPGVTFSANSPARAAPPSLAPHAGLARPTV
jgi:hypothetical protein